MRHESAPPLPPRLRFGAGLCQMTGSGIRVSVPSHRAGTVALRASCGVGVGASLFLAAASARAQEGLRILLANQVATEARTGQLSPQPYTFKVDDFSLLASSLFSLELNDNINASRSEPLADAIVAPGIGIAARYPITPRNLLTLDVTLAYRKYLRQDNYSTWTVNSVSGLGFDIWWGDFWFNVHDRPQYSQYTFPDASVAETGKTSTFDNDIGIGAQWNLNDLVLNLGYDHLNTTALYSEGDYLNRATEVVSARGALRVHPRFTVGTEATVSFTRYDQILLNDYQTYSLGLFGDWQPHSALRLQPRVGYTLYQFDQTSPSLGATDTSTWYLDLTGTHQITDALSVYLSSGHELRVGLQSELIEDWYARPGAIWALQRKVTVRGSASYEQGNQTFVGQTVGALGNFNERYDWLGTDLGVDYRPVENLTVSLDYRLGLRGSNLDDRNYAQNSVILALLYRFK